MKRLVVILVAASVLLSFGSYARAGGKAHAYGKHKIKGEHVDMAAVERLLDESTEPGRVVVGRSGKTIEKLEGKFQLPQGMPYQQAIVGFLKGHGRAYGLYDIEHERKPENEKGGFFNQNYKGVPVWGHFLKVYSDANMEMYRIESNLIPTSALALIDTTPAISEASAIEIAGSDRLSNQPGKIHRTMAKLHIIEGPKLAYIVTFLQKFNSWVYFIDAETGEVIKSFCNDSYDGSVDASGVVRITKDPSVTTTVV